MAADSGNDVITSGEHRPEMEADNVSTRHVVCVSHCRQSFYHRLYSILLLLLALMTSQSLALSGKYVNRRHALLLLSVNINIHVGVISLV